MTKRIRFLECTNPLQELENIDNMYSAWVHSRSPYYKEVILNRINRLQPYMEYELLYEGINYNI